MEALTGGSAHPSVPRMDLPGGRPYPGGRGGPRSASAGAKAGGFLNHPAAIDSQDGASNTKCLEKQRGVTAVFVSA